MINILKKLLDFIYEKKCYFCSKSDENSVCCSKCYNSVVFLPSEPHNNILGVPVYAATDYKDLTQKLIRAVKYHNQTELADYQAKLMFDYWSDLDVKNKNYTVIPVPMFFLKARKRKYNHMDLVCQKFCELSGYIFNNHSIIRNRETKPQYKLSKKEREDNLKNAFSIVDKDFKEPILLMDDISTTGTTFKEIISLLNAEGFYNIVCFVTAVPEHPFDY